MPGGRLTPQERRRIAQGLAEGLAYAEIARGLGRPTSTVTREVMRNGGPNAYRAALAQLATERRTRRSRTPVSAAGTPAARGPGAPGPDTDTGAVRAYEEMFAANFMLTGMPAMMSRVLACLTISDTGSLTAGELARRLNVSPASISKAIAVLEDQSQVRREKAEGRRERYVVDDDVWYQSILASARNTANLAAIAHQGVGVLGEGTGAAVRLAKIARFVGFVSESIRRSAEEAREFLHADGGGGGYVAGGAGGGGTGGTDAGHGAGRELRADGAERLDGRRGENGRDSARSPHAARSTG